MGTLQQHGLVLGDQEVTPEVEDHVSLKQQNSELRRVISEMRREMEAMSSDVNKDDEPTTVETKGVPQNSSTFQTGSLCATIATKSVSLNSSTFQTGSMYIITQVILSSWKKNWHY